MALISIIILNLLLPIYQNKYTTDYSVKTTALVYNVGSVQMETVGPLFLIRKNSKGIKITLPNKLAFHVVFGLS